MTRPAKLPSRKDDRIIIHFDYDCFYASVVEAENPALKTLPLAIQQKQIIVTCNYEARRRGLYKLQLITEAKSVCPDVIIVLGEDLTRFRNASKELYNFLRRFSWNDRVERLGFDEVWMDVTDIVNHNVELLNHNNLSHSFFQLERDDPTQGFAFNATSFAGHVYPKGASTTVATTADAFTFRLSLGSHFALHLRHLLEEQKGYTSTVGISTSRLLSKLIGNVNKPKGQTTLLPPYEEDPRQDLQDNVQSFMDHHDIGAVPWIGFKTAQRLREAVLRRSAGFETGLVYGGSKESVKVEMVRKLPTLSAEDLEKLLGGPGQPRGIGARVWSLLHGVDDSEVGQARNVPRQISIEDSYVRLDTMKQLTEELNSLSMRLIERMRIDLTDFEDPPVEVGHSEVGQRRHWIGRPHMLRLTTRPRLPIGADGTRPRTFKRISRSGLMPAYVFSLNDNLESLAQRLVIDNLLPLFRKLHPEKSGWNLSLVNVAATDMVDTGANSKDAVGRNIQSMFQNQNDVLREFRLVDRESTEREHPGAPMAEIEEVGPSEESPEPGIKLSTEIVDSSITLFNDDEGEDEEDLEDSIDSESDAAEVSGSQGYECPDCGEMIPEFARVAHNQAHRDAG